MRLMDLENNYVLTEDQQNYVSYIGIFVTAYPQLDWQGFEQGANIPFPPLPEFQPLTEPSAPADPILTAPSAAVSTQLNPSDYLTCSKLQSCGGSAATTTGLPQLPPPSLIAAQLTLDAMGNLISQDGGGVVSNDGGSLITQDGGTVVARAGDTVFVNGQAYVVSNDGGSLISQDGGGLTISVPSGGGASIIGFNGSGIIGLHSSGIIGLNSSGLVPNTGN
jgi:hypothetical protein